MIHSYVLIIALAIIFVPNEVTGRHFRGGYISWSPTGREREVELFFRLAYHHGFFSDPETSEDGEDCTREAIRTKSPIPTGGEFTCITTTYEDGERIEDETELFDGMPPYYTCTNIKDSGDNVDLHWASGYNRTVITLPEQENSNQVWSVGYDSCCWLNTLINYRSPRTWRLRTKIDLSPRNDLNGRSNTSPYVEGLPMKTVAQDCITAIPINAIDKDGDRLSCRWTSSRKSECESANCGNPDSSIFTMKSSTCKILVNAVNAEPGLYAVAVIIEDYPMGRRRRSAFSKIPYQFLVNIQRRNVECNRVVTEEPQKACYAVPYVISPPFKIDLHAQTTDPSIPIVSIDMITQPGMRVSNLIDDGNGRYHVRVSWTPPADKLGDVEQLCYQAVDVENIAGQELCVKLFIGGRVPEPVPIRSIPSSNESEIIHYVNQKWELHFTEQVQLSDATYNAAVVFMLDNGTEVFAVTLKDENKVNVTTEEPFYLSFTTPEFDMQPGTNYTIRLEAGVVVGTEGCNLPSEKIEWSFLTSRTEMAIRNYYDDYPNGIWVECLPTFMVTYIEREYFPDILDPSILSYEDPDCYGIVHNDTHLALGTMYGKCGTRAIVNDDQSRVSMINTFFLPLLSPFKFDNVLSRSENAEVRINCSIPTRRVAYVEFETNSSTFLIQKDDVGNFGYSLKLFPDEDYRKPYRVWDFPVSVESNSRLYFEARTYDVGNVVPFLQECVATPTYDPRSTLRYVIIREGCAEDETVIFHNHPSSKRIRFSIEAFSFIGYNLQSSIFVHCDIRNCNSSCSDINCPEAEPNPNLSKRSVSSIRMKSGDENTDGPIRIFTTGENGFTYRKTGFSLAETILTCLVSVAIVMVMLLAYLIVKVSKQANPRVCAHCSQKSQKSKLALISTKSKI